MCAPIRSCRVLLPTILDAFNNLGLVHARVGVELGAEQCLDMPLVDFMSLQRSLPGVEFVDAAPAIWPARMRKSECELALLRQAGQITSARPLPARSLYCGRA